MIHRHELDLAGRSFSVETGRMAKQADGAVVVRYGETVVLVAVVGAKEARPGFDFLPLTVDYREMTFAQGKIPGGFFKREGRPTEKEILTMRMTDRPIRPLFPAGYNCEIQVFATVLSADTDNDPDILAVFGASAALGLSGIPFAGPIAAVRIGRIDGQLIVNPTYDQLAKSDLNLTVAGGREGLNMVEGGAQEIEESVLLDALFLAADAINPLLDIQDKLKGEAGKPTREFSLPARDEALAAKVREVAEAGLSKASQTIDKQARYEAYDAVKRDTLAALADLYPEREKEIKDELGAVKKSVVRQRITKEQIRIDGRGPTDIRPIESEAGFLPRVHGSTMFQRGETQALCTTTLGSTRDTQRIEAFGGETTRSFMLHYKFPSYCVGEVRPIRGPSRREIGHGALAERALKAVLPDGDDFPYTIRIFSEITESNGSSSMATVCGGCMSMMDAGVPIRASVAGIAMGLIKEGSDFAILSDILGDEDHLGDMDFKVAGTAKGITAVQMDIKCDGLTREIMSRALDQAKAGRLHILEKMAETLREPRPEISSYAPRITTIEIPVERIKDVIGPGGRIIRKIQDETGAVLEIENDGRVRIFASNQEASQKAIDAVKACTEEPEVGRIYPGIVKKIMDFGAFVEILPGVEGLVHISQLAPERVQSTSDVCKEGDEFPVKVLEIDRSGKIRLSRKEAMADAAKAG